MHFFLLALCILEALLITFWSNIAGPYISPLLLLLSGFGIGLLYLKSKPQQQMASPGTGIGTYILPIQVLLFVVISLCMFFKVHSLNIAFPVSADDASHSDVIPSIMQLTKRFVNGEFPYKELHFPTHSLSPTYLPFTWLPYSVAELLHIDYRWVPFFSFFLISAYFFAQTIGKRYHYKTIVERVISPIFPLLVWCLIVKDDNELLAYTVESLIAAYYLLLVISLKHKNPWLIGVTLSLCLLSRYSVLLWVPLCLLILWFSDARRRNVIITSLVMVAAVILLYVLPFLRHDPTMFKQGYDYYTLAAAGEWRKAISDNAYWHIGNGLGFSKWMISLFPSLSVEQMVGAYKNFHLVASCGLVGFLGLYYIRNRRNIAADKMMIFSFKLYLTVFYAFVQVPYSYLFFVPIVISSVLLTDAYKYSGEQKNPIVS